MASSKLQFLCSHTGQSHAKPPCTYVVDSNHITTFFFLEIINQSHTVMGHFHLVCRDSCHKCLPNHYIMTNQGFPGRENIVCCVYNNLRGSFAQVMKSGKLIAGIISVLQCEADQTWGGTSFSWLKSGQAKRTINLQFNTFASKAKVNLQQNI